LQRVYPYTQAHAVCHSRRCGTHARNPRHCARFRALLHAAGYSQYQQGGSGSQNCPAQQPPQPEPEGPPGGSGSGSGASHGGGSYGRGYKRVRWPGSNQQRHGHQQLSVSDVEAVVRTALGHGTGPGTGNGQGGRRS
jgi:hypothetical protein